MPVRPGIVDLRDLARRYQWEPRAIAPFLASARLEVAYEPAWRGYEPPRVVVVIAPFHEPRLLQRSRAWLADAARVVIVRDATGQQDLFSDREMRELLEGEWREVLATMPSADVHDWLDASDGTSPRAAISRAIDRAQAATEAQAKAPPRASPDLELPATPWVEWRARGRFEQRRIVASRMALRDGRAIVVDDHGYAHDLATLCPPTVIAIDDDPANRPARPPSAEDRWMHPGYYVGAVDPVHPVAWRGDRMDIYWSYVGAGETGLLSATDHDWPCGPSKKLWGFDDNNPISVAIAPAGDRCAQTFDHDVLLTVGMPIGWHRAGPVDVAAFTKDRRRAVYYAQTPEFVAERSVDDLLEEDNRELPPVVVLGPDDAARYAVDLRHRVVRITYRDDAEVAAIVGGPDAGYAVFDEEHRIIRRGEGRLLGGWFRHATIEHDDWLWREDLATGRRTLLGSAMRVRCVDPTDDIVVEDAIREGRHELAAQLRERVLTEAIAGELCVVAIPGTRNILEIADRYLRVL